MPVFLSKTIKFFVAILLLPILPAVAMGIWNRAGELNARLLFLENPLSLCFSGFVIWGIFALLFQFPARVYVAAHELTHALFVKLCGGRVKKIAVRGRSGYVLSDRANFLIALAPYLFPFYAVVWSVLGLATIFFLPFFRWQVVFWVGFGFCVGYHWTMTARMLTTRQTDFSSQGYFFSFVMIITANLTLLLFILLLLPDPRRFPDQITALGADTLQFYKKTFQILRKLDP